MLSWARFQGIGEMNVEDLRDIVIVIAGIGALVAALVLAVMGFILFRKLSSILSSVRSTMNSVDAFNNVFLKPGFRISNILSALERVLSWIAGSKEKKGHGDAR